MGSNAVDDIQSLVENNNFSAGTVTLNGRLSSATYLGAKIQIKSFGDDSSNSFTIVGTDLDGKALQEVIVGTNGSVAIGNQVFKTVTQITPVQKEGVFNRGDAIVKVEKEKLTGTAPGKSTTYRRKSNNPVDKAVTFVATLGIPTLGAAAKMGAFKNKY